LRKGRFFRVGKNKLKGEGSRLF